jgi:hypothetical protein
MTINLGNEISRTSESGLQVRVYSDYPFKTRETRQMDETEWEALVKLRRTPDQPIAVFEDYEQKPVLRYFKARKMTKQACIDCHNSHPDSPKKDWKLNQVRGVLEIIRPLEREANRTRTGLQTSAALITGVATTLLILCIGLLLVAESRQADENGPAHSR